MDDKTFISRIIEEDTACAASQEFIQYYADMWKIYADPNIGLEGQRRVFEKWGDFGAEPRDVDYIEVDADGVKCMWLLPKECIEDRVVICCHGGGYTYGSMYSHRKSYAHLVKQIGCKGLIVNYSRIPEKNWPAPLEETLDASRCFEKNINPKVVQTILGHKKIDTTLDIYTDCNIDTMRNEFKRFEMQ